MTDQEKAARARDLQREYIREWRRKNKEKVRSYNTNYWLRKAETMGGEANAEVTGTE